MKIVFDFPPIYDEIRSEFPTAGRGVIFAWGDKIYNPFCAKIEPQLIAHERVHGRRQGKDIRGWWQRYLHEKEFRLIEEILAHIAEMESLLGPNPNRQMRRYILKNTARRLANPIYRYGLSRAKAVALLKRQLVA